MMSAFLAREVAFTPSAPAMASNCSRSLLSRTERSRASVDSTLMGTFFRVGVRNTGGPVASSAVPSR
jgi:hypothetical protein